MTLGNGNGKSERKWQQLQLQRNKDRAVQLISANCAPGNRNDTIQKREIEKSKLYLIYIRVKLRSCLELNVREMAAGNDINVIESAQRIKSLAKLFSIQHLALAKSNRNYGSGRL